MAGCENRFEKEPVNRFVGIVQRGQVDFPIPTREQLVVRHELSGEIVGKEEPYLRCPSEKAGAEITRGHLIRVSEGIQSSKPTPFVEMGGDHGHCGRSDARNSRGLSKRRRAYL